MVTQHKLGGQMDGWIDAGMDVQYVWENGKHVMFTKMLSDCRPIVTTRHTPGLCNNVSSQDPFHCSAVKQKLNVAQEIR